MNNIKTNIRFFKKHEAVFISILIIDLLNITLHIIAFSGCMEIVLFNGTIKICVEVHLCKTTGPRKRYQIHLFARITYHIPMYCTSKISFLIRGLITTKQELFLLRIISITTKRDQWATSHNRGSHGRFYYTSFSLYFPWDLEIIYPLSVG